MKSYLNAIPDPFLLNPWKHHLGYIRSHIPVLRLQESQVIKNHLLMIGESVTDIYYGNMTVQQVCDDIRKRLEAEGIFEKPGYFAWLDTVSDYESLPVSDGSLWLMRAGNDMRYIHIHPAKISPMVSRVKNQQLKTAILYLVCKDGQTEISRLQHINALRRDFLNLSALKHISHTQERVISLLSDGMHDKV